LLAVPVLSAGYVAGASVAFSSAQLWLPVAVPLLLGTPVALVTVILLRYSAAKNIVRRLAPRQIADQLLRRSKIERGEANVEQSTIMFVDLEASTSLGERMEMDAFQDVMTRFYEASGEAIENQDGMIVEFKGDGILALFNESIAGESHAAKACRAARDVSNSVAAVRFTDQGDSNARLKLRFGLHTGAVSTGSIGSQQRFSFNALGDAVNTASRLEQFGKKFRKEKTDIILLSEDTFQQSQMPENAAILVGREKLRGKSGETAIYRLIGGG
jgi:adenylate cyclase